MNTNQVLILRFKLDSGKKYSVRIKDANPNVAKDSVRQLVDQIVKLKAFNFDGKQSPYTYDSAVFTTTSKKAVIAPASADGAK